MIRDPPLEWRFRLCLPTFFFLFGWGSFRISRPENSSQLAQTVLIHGDDEMSASRVSGLILLLKRKTL